MNQKKYQLLHWMQPGQRVWIQQLKSPEPYIKAILNSVSETKIICKLQDNSTVEVKPPQIQQRSQSTTLYSDLMDVQTLNNAELLQQLKGNFNIHKIYSFVGPTLIITNPYEFYPELYTKQLKHYYLEKIIEENINYKDLEPHLYGVVAEVIRTLFKNKINQSILISGESGAGKTEANKECMVLISEYFDEGQQNLHEKVLSCNPLLESFGNAKTIRNDNSSRFGRFVEISVRGKEIKRATITSYLLEKSRVTSQLQGQRNFHIFYAFILGCTQQQKLKYNIPENPLQQFQYLKNTTMMHVDQQNYEDVKKSFQTLGFKENQQVVWKILASILHIGNLKFILSTSSNKNDQTCEIVNKNVLDLIAKLLGLNAELLLKSLTCYQIKVGSDSLIKPFTISEIKEIKDSLSRVLYQKLFNWLIICLNENLGKQPKGAEPVIGLLDIYGFEVLKQNSFEQLCINFTNERLHQLYIEQVFKGEKLLFESQGLSQHLTSIQFKDNQQLIDLLDTNMLSIFNLLDQWCTVASTEQAFITNLSYYHKKNNYFPTSNLSSKDSFVIKHTPRDVQYVVTTFREKNKNLLRDDVVNVLRESSIVILSDMFKEDLMQDKPLNSNRNKIKKFLGSKFRNQMNELIKSLQDKSQLFFIRCIKSNGSKSPGLFDSKVALQQIRYLGILDTIKMRKNSYSTRMRYKMFLDKYPWWKYFIVGGKGLDDGKITFHVIEKFCQQFSQDEVIFGFTKIFLRSYADYELNSRYRAHVKKLEKSTHIIISSLIKNSYLNKTRERIKNRLTINRYLETFKQYLLRTTKVRAATDIQRFYLKYSSEKKLKQKRDLCITVQKYWRRIIENQKRKKILNAVHVIEHHYKRYLIKKRFQQYLIVRPIAEKYLIDMTWNLLKFIHKQTIEQYLSVMVNQYKNKPKIKQFESNIRNYESVQLSQSVQKYFHAISPQLHFNKCITSIKLIQTSWLTMKLRRQFLTLKAATNKIKKFWKQYYHKRVHSKRIFNKFFESYITDLDTYNQYSRNILFGTKRSKQDNQFYIEESLKNYVTNYKTKMTIIYYMLDFESFILLEDIYPYDSWVENYCKVYKEGLNRNIPLQQIKVTEQFTAVATSHRLYEWGGFKQNSQKIHMINTTESVYSYSVNQQQIQINTKQPVPIKQYIKQNFTYKKRFLLQQFNIYQMVNQNFIQVKIMNILKFNGKIKEEKVLDLSCGDGHIVCRTLSKKIYSWGTNKYGQLGHQNFNYIGKPKSISLIEKNQIAEPLQISTSANSTIVLMSNKKILWCGKNGTINNLNTLTEINLEGRTISNNQLFAPLRIQVSHSRTMSVIGATYVSFNGVLDKNIPLRNKVVGIMSAKFQEYGMDLINLPFDKNIANYVSEATIRMPVYKQSIEMESRRQLRKMQEEVKQTLGVGLGRGLEQEQEQWQGDVSFAKGMEHGYFK